MLLLFRQFLQMNVVICTIYSFFLEYFRFRIKPNQIIDVSIWFFILGWSWTVWPGSRENWVAMGNSRGADRAHSAVPRKRWGFRHQTASWCDEATRPPSQLSQIHGHFSPSAHLLFTLQWLYLGPGQTGLSVPNLRMCGPQALSRVHHDKVFWSQRTDKVWRCKQKPSYILLTCF